jgi:hypothetical protein
MGIKTKFNPMGGRSGSNEPDLGNLSLWRYSNDVIQGKTLLYEYLGGGIRTQFLYNYNSTNNNYYGYLKNSQPANGDYIYWGDGGGLNFYNNGYKIYNVTLSTFQWNWLGTVMTMNSYTTGGFNVNVIEGYPDTLYVPRVGGKAVINDCNATPWYTQNNVPFLDNPYIKNVDLQNVPFRNNSMFNAFFKCTNLVSVVNISKNVINMAKTFTYCNSFNQNVQMPNFVTNMFETFNSCFNLNQNIQIPNTVLNMSNAFSGCYNLNQNIKIPNSVTDVANAFSGCNNLNQNIQIPNSVTTMSRTFQSCHNLNQNIRIPDSVTNILRTFINCHSLNQNIQISNSATEMIYTFSGCYNLNQNIRIPNSVTNMYSTFYNCRNLEATINILSPILSNATLCFGGTNPLKLKRVFIPYKWSNGTYTATFNAFKLAGYIYTNEVSTGQHNTIFNDIGIL